MASYGFPLLPIEQIITDYYEIFDTNLDEDSFKKPDPYKWEQLYQMILSEMTGGRVEVYTMQAKYMDNMDPDLLKDCIPMMHIILGLQKLLVPCGITDFSLRDILSPTKQRLMKVASAVINFMKFKGSAMDKYNEIKSSVSLKREHQDTLMKRNEELKRRINHVKAERAEQQPKIAQVQQQIDEVERKMQEHGRTVKSIQNPTSELKTNIEERKAAADQVHSNTLKVRDESDQLSQKIVQSPDRVRVDQEMMIAKLAAQKESLEKKKKRLAELWTSREKVSQCVNGDIEKGQQLLNGLKEAVNKENELEETLARMTEEIQEKTEQHGLLRNKRDRVQHMLTTREEKLTKMGIVYQNKLKALQEQRDNLKQEINTQFNRKSVDEGKKKQLLDGRLSKEDELNMEKRALGDKIQATMDIYTKILEKLDLVHNNFRTAFEYHRIEEKPRT